MRISGIFGGILFSALAGSQSLAKSDYIAERNATRPPCSEIVFTGFAVAPIPENLETVQRSRDLQDLAARNPLSCRSYADNFVHMCRGMDYFVNQRAFIVNWSSTWLQIVMPIDLVRGTVDAQLFIARRGITCRDKNRPDDLITDNVARYWRTIARPRIERAGR